MDLMANQQLIFCILRCIKEIAAWAYLMSVASALGTLSFLAMTGFLFCFCAMMALNSK